MHLDCFGLDCMTRHRRNQLTRELWRLRANLGAPRSQAAPAGDGSRRSPTHNNNNHTSCTQPEDMKLKSTLNSILKRLNIEDLELLLESVKSKGRAHDHCIYLQKHSTLSQNHNQKQTTTESSHPANDRTCAVPPANAQNLVSESKAVCQAWRWPELMDNVTLKQLPNCLRETTTNRSCSSCESDQEDIKPTLTTAERKLVCINPYHWSKVFYLRGKSHQFISFTLICYEMKLNGLDWESIPHAFMTCIQKSFCLDAVFFGVLIDWLQYWVIVWLYIWGIRNEFFWRIDILLVADYRQLTP